MSRIDNAVLAVGTGSEFFTAPTDTAAPIDLKAVAEPWTSIGHTSLEDIMAFDSEGGDETVLGTLQNPTLRTTRTNRVESFTINLQQFDEDALKLFYGSDSEVDGEWMQVKGTGVPTQVAFLAVFKDGNNRFAIYAPKVEIFRADNLEISDTESLASLPLKITPLQSGSNDYLYSVTPLGTV